MDIKKLKEQISKGMHLAFQKLVRQKQAENGILVMSEKGQIRKIKASDIRS